MSTLDRQNEDPWSLSPLCQVPAQVPALRAQPTVSVEANPPPPPGCPWAHTLFPVCGLWTVPHTHTLVTTHNVIHQVTGSPDHKQADQRCKQREPGQCGDLGDALWEPDVTSSTLPSFFRPDPSTVTSRPPPGFPRLPLLSLL